MRLLIAVLVLFTTVAVITDTRASAGEWQDKPVMCGDEQEVFGLMGSKDCLLYTSPSPRDRTRSRMPSSA